MWMFVYLDDAYVVCSRDDVGRAYETITRCLVQECGISVNTGKTQAWCRTGGDTPPGLPHNFWRQAQGGITVLGCPFGSTEYIRAQCDRRLLKQRNLQSQAT